MRGTVLYVHKHGPLTSGEADHLASVCRTPRERRVIWTLLDTGLLVTELAELTQSCIALSSNCLYASARGKPRLIPLTPRISPLLDNWFRDHQSFGMSVRTI